MYGFFLTVLWLTFACGPKPLPQVPKPAITERVDARAELPVSRLHLPLQTDLASYEPLLAEVLREHLTLRQKNWTRVTGPGVEPAVETLMEGRVEAPTLRVEGGAVRIDVTVSYWGEVRAQAKTRFGSMWLSRGTVWGTETNPGRIRLRLFVKPEVDAQFRLRTTTQLASVKLEAPTFDQVCTDTIIRVCISHERAVKYVHGQLDREIKKRARPLLAALDKEVTKRVDLRGALTIAHRALSTPAAPGHLWLGVERLGLGPLRGEGRVARLELELVFRPHWHAEPAAKPKSLPPKAPLTQAPNALTFDLILPFRELTKTLAQAAPSMRGERYRLMRIEALGASGGAGLALALELDTKRGTHAIYVAAEPRVEGDALVFADARLSTDSQKLLDALDIDGDAFTAQFEQHAKVPLDTHARRQASDLQKRLALITLTFDAVALELEEPRYSDVWFAKEALAVRVSSGAKTSIIR